MYEKCITGLFLILMYLFSRLLIAGILQQFLSGSMTYIFCHAGLYNKIVGLFFDFSLPCLVALIHFGVTISVFFSAKSYLDFLERGFYSGFVSCSEGGQPAVDK